MKYKEIRASLSFKQLKKINHVYTDSMCQIHIIIFLKFADNTKHLGNIWQLSANVLIFMITKLCKQ